MDYGSRRASSEQTIKLRQLFTLAFGTIIGVGWITVIGPLLGLAGPGGIWVSFVLGGLMIMFIGWCYAELAASRPVPGGEFVYAYEYFGGAAAFAVGWVLALLFIVVTAFEAVSIGWVFGALIPDVQGPPIYVVAGESVRLGEIALGVGGMLMISALNYRGARSAAAAQDFLTYLLLAVSVVFIGAAVAKGDTGNLAPLFVRDNSGSIWSGVLAAMAVAPFFYAGFNVIPQAMGEISATEQLRLLGRVTSLVVVASIAFYCFVVYSVSAAMPRRELLDAQLPAALAIETVLNSRVMGQLVLLAGVLGLLTTWNAVFFAATRVLFAMGRARMLPAKFATIHPRYKSPTFAIISVAVVGVLGVLLGKGFVLPAANIAGLCIALMFLVVCAAAVKLRKTSPTRARPYKVPGGMATVSAAAFFSVIIFCIAVSQPFINSGELLPIEWRVGVGWALVGAIVWFANRTHRRSISEPERKAIIEGDAIRRP